MKVTVSRKAHFNAAHRLFNSSWTDARNKEVFGKCSLPNYHGHNYNLTVTIRGEINPETGYVYDLGKLKTIIENEVEERFDHKNLNLDTVEFRNLNPTAENIAVVIWNLLRPLIESQYELKVQLFETDRNSVEYSGSDFG